MVTIDAMGCQKKIAQTIRDEKADYVLRVKENQGNLYQDIADWFAYAEAWLRQPEQHLPQGNSQRAWSHCHTALLGNC